MAMRYFDSGPLGRPGLEGSPQRNHVVDQIFARVTGACSEIQEKLKPKKSCKRPLFTKAAKRTKHPKNETRATKKPKTWSVHHINGRGGRESKHLYKSSEIPRKTKKEACQPFWTTGTNGFNHI